MDYKVATSIFSTPWLIESQAALTVPEILAKANSVSSEAPLPRQAFFLASDQVIAAPTDRWDAQRHPGYEGKTIAVLPITGPLMKDDFYGYFGTTSLLNELHRMNAASSLKTIILQIDSPGGMVAGTQSLAEAIKASEKEVIAIICGMACSAAYWIASAADKIVATSGTDIIGSIGTMGSFFDESEYLKKIGIERREYTADDSKDKNKASKEARAGNGKLYIEETLNPLNDIFLSAVKANRGEKLNEKETLTGKTFVAEKAKELGLIDEISTMDKTINSLISKNKSTTLTMKFPSLRALLGFAAATEKVVLEDAHLDKVEASINDLNTITAERDSLKTKVTELETAAAAANTTATDLQGQVTALTTERDNLKAEVDALGALDAGKPSGVAKSQDNDNDSEEVDALAMDFQTELFAKL